MNTRKTLIIIALILATIGIFLTIKKYNGIRINDNKTADMTIKSDLNAVSVIKTDVSKLERKQDSLFAKSTDIGVKYSKTKPVSKLLPKRSQMNDTTKIKQVGANVVEDTTTYDSIRRELIYKELLFDSLLEVNNSLIYSVLQERSLNASKDSLYWHIIATMDTKYDSLQNSVRKAQRMAYWKGIKHGLIIGSAVGGTVGFSLK